MNKKTTRTVFMVLMSLMLFGFVVATAEIIPIITCGNGIPLERGIIPYQSQYKYEVWLLTEEDAFQFVREIELSILQVRPVEANFQFSQELLDNGESVNGVPRYYVCSNVLKLGDPLFWIGVFIVEQNETDTDLRLTALLRTSDSYLDIELIWYEPLRYIPESNPFLARVVDRTD
jgi:hypothetical protein